MRQAARPRTRKGPLRRLPRLLGRAAAGLVLLYALTVLGVVAAAERMLDRHAVDWVGGGGRVWATASGMAGAPRIAPPFDAAIVLGGPMDPDQRPAWPTRRRVDAGVALLARGEALRLILSGGPSDAAGRGPAAMMRAHAIEQGAPEEMLALEPTALTTLDNLVQGLALADARGWRRVAVVSDAWHLPRAMLLARLLGRGDLVPVAVNARPWMWTRDTPLLYLREAAAWWLNLGRAALWLAGREELARRLPGDLSQPADPRPASSPDGAMLEDPTRGPPVPGPARDAHADPGALHE